MRNLIKDKSGHQDSIKKLKSPQQSLNMEKSGSGQSRRFFLRASLLSGGGMMLGMTWQSSVKAADTGKKSGSSTQ
jgi:hypothetical protein